MYKRQAFLRYHDPDNWPMLREALKNMGRADLIGNGKKHLIPLWQPQTDGTYHSPRRKNSTAARKPGTPAPGTILTQHTGLPPREQGQSKASESPVRRRKKVLGNKSAKNKFAAGRSLSKR